MRPDLSIEARALPESLRILADHGAGPSPGVVTVEKAWLERWSTAAQELYEAAQAHDRLKG